MRLLKQLLPTYFFFITLFVFTDQDIKAIQNHEGSGNPVKIGLLISVNSSLEAKNGAELATRIANKKGGYNGKPFQLVVRSMEGPWGTGSKQAVNLVFDEKVCALIGSHDGRNAHLVEQVAAKTRTVFLSAWSSDPTLAQAFVPWYFSCVPNDLQQASALINEIYNKRKYNKVAVISDKSYDSDMAVKCFEREAAAAGKPDPALFYYDKLIHDFNNLLEQVNKSEAGCILIYGEQEPSIELLKQIQLKNLKQEVFCALTVFSEKSLSEQELQKTGTVVIVTSGYRMNSRGSAFREDYQNAYGNIPGDVAAYAYDGMNLIIEAIREAGTDRDKISQTLAKIQYEGVTGIIRFDEKGNRLGDPELIQIKNGIPVFVNKD